MELRSLSTYLQKLYQDVSDTNKSLELFISKISEKSKPATAKNTITAIRNFNVLMDLEGTSTEKFIGSLRDLKARGELKKELIYRVFQDLPEEWKNLVPIKNITGESLINIRGFNQKNDPTENKIKIFATANKLPEIKEDQKNAMYSARLSLLHNIEKEPFEEDGELEDRIVKNEAENLQTMKKLMNWKLSQKRTTMMMILN